MPLLISVRRILVVPVFLFCAMSHTVLAQKLDTVTSPHTAPGGSNGTVGVAGPSVKAAAPLRPVLVELFTSEGCSSCPPADDLLGKLQGTTTDAGQMVVALSEHVTYWNQLGWSDPFSKEIFSERQNAYGEHFGLDEVYTPQVVVNGNHEVSGNDAAGIRRALLAESYMAPQAGTGNRAEPEILHIVSVKLWARPATKADPAQNFAIVTVTLKQPVPSGADVYAAVADDMDYSQVLRGENAGRSLMHVAVARTLTRMPRPNDAGTTTFMVPLPGTAVQSQHLVMFVQAADQGSVLSVVSAPVPNQFPQSAAVR
jgi:hypothetical protein